MSTLQRGAVAITIALSAVDGYDFLSLTFAAPAIGNAWGVGKAALGIVLSSGLLGMALGSFLLAPLADVLGRRPLVLASLALMASGMLFSAAAHRLGILAASRVLTGLGIGACIAVINPLAAEFSNARWRSFALSAMAMGYPVGGVIGGLLSALLLKLYGWPAIFVSGAIATLALMPLVALFLPEPLVFLINRRNPNRLQRVNALLFRCGHDPVESVAIPPPATRRGYMLVFAPSQVRTTLWITTVNLLFVVAVYYVFSWLPQMVADAGYTPSIASLVTTTRDIIGVAGGLLLGAIARGPNLYKLAGGAMISMGLATAAFGITPASLPMLIIAAGTCGFFLYAGAAGGYASLATSFSDEARASGSGFVIGVGRVGSAIAPTIAGWLFASGLRRAEVCAIFAASAVIAGILLASRGTTPAIVSSMARTSDRADSIRSNGR